jgi:hypothetical protein
MNNGRIYPPEAHAFAVADAFYLNSRISYVLSSDEVGN